jgi:hypothetical protein
MDRLVVIAKRVGIVLGALTAMAAMWVSIGGPRLATSQDIQKLDRKQTETAVDLYAKDVRDAIILRGAVQDTTTRQLIDENLRDAQEKLKAAQQRKIELSR